MIPVHEPDVSIVVSTHNRPVRLRWLLNALLDQTHGRFEVIVAHDAPTPDTTTVLRAHPLLADGRLRELALPPRGLLAAAKRDAAWRAARAPLILFTDDDCRPAPGWIAAALAAARAHPGSILQGRTRPDPDELAVLHGSPWAQTMSVEPPTVWAQTCNIAYPRALLEQIGGFDLRLPVGEDTDLALRARATGAALVAAPELLVLHAVDDARLPARIRSLARWQHIPLAVRLHPHELRRAALWRLFWKREHAALIAAAASVSLSRRRPAAALLALPWLALSLRHRGYGPRGLARSVSELPGRALLDAAELLYLARGSVRYRTVLL